MSNTDTEIDPSKSTTTSTLRVRFCETDLMGIVHHATYLVYFEAGRVEWLRRRGITYADWKEKALAMVPLRAISQPIDIANLALFLACDESRTITGQSINCDAGGYMVG